MPAIDVTNLRKEYGDVTALDGVDLTVPEGSVFGFLGPNGAGKSTTINVLLGFVTPTAGSARVFDTPVESGADEIRRRMGVLPEDFEPYDRLTAREHVTYAAELKGVTPDVEGLLDRTGLEREAWDRRAGGYSTGMAQRLALACALVGDPDLLVLDEPSAGLDPQGMTEMRDLIRREAERGTTVFFSSHVLSEVEAVCDRVAILSAGELAATGPLEELRTDAAANAMLALTVDRVPDGLPASVAGLDGVVDASRDGDTIQVELTDPAEKVSVITHVHGRCDVRNVISERASLETMFDSYTEAGKNGETDPVEEAPEVTA
jgi:ABC-2 type transport system ATP-binding protein